MHVMHIPAESQALASPSTALPPPPPKPKPKPSSKLSSKSMSRTCPPPALRLESPPPANPCPHKKRCSSAAGALSKMRRLFPTARASVSPRRGLATGLLL